ncbi:MAG: hydrogenase formation protein HypD [Nanobdellota archaeon]
MNELLKEINPSRAMTLMEVCGGHTHTIMKYGIRDAVPVRLVSGPGCPVCVSSQRDIDCMIAIANAGVPVATYGDMLRVPGSTSTLEDARNAGATVFTVYSAAEVLTLKKDYPNIVFFGIGFETTAPMTTFLLEEDVCVYSVHKTIPEAMQLLVEGEAIDGFISPGHVATIIGAKAFEGIHAPQAISGFSAEQMIKSIYILVRMIEEGKTGVINAYPEVVSVGGNKKAQERMKTYFTQVDSEWRGLGVVPQSGLEVRQDRLNAKIKYAHLLKDVTTTEHTGCRCGEVLKGMDPGQCPLFRTACTPENPHGACMVSEEGSCQIAHRYNG